MILKNLFPLLFVWCFSEAASPAKPFQQIDVPFAVSKKILSLKIFNQKLGSLGKCATPGSKKSAPCPEPSWPGKCALKEVIPSEAFEVVCKAQEGSDSLLLSQIERVGTFKFPDDIINEMQLLTEFKEKPRDVLRSLITTANEKWGKIYSWTPPVKGSRIYFYICPAGDTLECFKANRDSSVEILFSVRKVVIKKL